MKRNDVYPIGKKNPNLPFHPAVRAGDFIFVSGQVAKDADGNMISGTIEEETKGTIAAIERILPVRRGAGDHVSRGHA
jgi:enamine deaminase RidA (YjgF/YER057c/UK114 family)